MDGMGLNSAKLAPQELQKLRDPRGVAVQIGSEEKLHVSRRDVIHKAGETSLLQWLASSVFEAPFPEGVVGYKPHTSPETGSQLRS